MTPEQLQNAITEKRQEQETFLMEANKQAAWYEGYIAALQAQLDEQQSPKPNGAGEVNDG